MGKHLGIPLASAPLNMSATTYSPATAIRQAVFSDYPQIVDLESRYGLGTRSYQEWSHLWLGNPAYRKRPNWPIGWVIEDSNRRLVGSLGNIPLEYTFEGNPILANTGRGLVADPAYRSACLLLLDRLINHSTADLYLNNTVGVDAAASFQLFDCPRVPAGAWDRAAFWITCYGEFSERLLRRFVGRAAKPLSYPVSAAAFLKDALRPAALRENDVAVEPCSAFDDRFDEFWHALKAKFPRLLLAVRTRETLDWHFKYALENQHLWIVTVRDASRLAAYAIFERKDGAAGYLRRVRLVDFQALDGGTALLGPILRCALRRCRQERIHVLENVGRWLGRREFIASAAPYRRAFPVWIYYYRANLPGLARSLADPSVWAPSLYDGDATL
jgi:hypothetical protein